MTQIFSLSFLNTLSLLSAITFTVAIAWQDYREFRIPNRWVYGFALASLLLAILRSMRGYPSQVDVPWSLFHWPTLSASVLGFVVAFVFTFFCWKRGWMGGGDVKLASALGLCVGFEYVLQILLLTHALAFVIHRMDDFVILAFRDRAHLGALRASERQISMGPFYAASLQFLLW